MQCTEQHKTINAKQHTSAKQIQSRCNAEVKVAKENNPTATIIVSFLL